MSNAITYPGLTSSDPQRRALLVRVFTSKAAQLNRRDAREIVRRAAVGPFVARFGAGLSLAVRLGVVAVDGKGIVTVTDLGACVVAYLNGAGS